MMRPVRRDELLLQAIALHQTGVRTTGRDQAIVGAQQERLADADAELQSGGRRSYEVNAGTKDGASQYDCRIVI
jgi:hypothetical protein